MPKVSLICESCGKEFERYPSDIREGTKHFFCSADCRKAYYKGDKVLRVCKQCGKEFYVYRSAIEKSNASGNFCCRGCYNEHQKTLTGSKNNHCTKVNRKCDYCGKEISVIPSRLRMYEHSFCSVKCRSMFMAERMAGEKNPQWKGGSSSYRGNFDEVKRESFGGVQFCAICGTTKDIHIHHIIPYRLTQDNSVDNLIPLCRKHHKTIESVTLKFIELFDDGEYDVAKWYLNITLREMQAATLCALKSAKAILEEKHEATSAS